jgi:hypothetical protein
LPVCVSRTTPDASQGDEPIAVLTATAVAPSGRAPCGRRPPSESAVQARTRLQARNAAFVSECSPSIGAMRRCSGMPSERPHAAGARHRRRLVAIPNPAHRWTGRFRGNARLAERIRCLASNRRRQGFHHVASVSEPRSRWTRRGRHDQAGDITRVGRCVASTAACQEAPRPRGGWFTPLPEAWSGSGSSFSLPGPDTWLRSPIAPRGALPAQDSRDIHVPPFHCVLTCSLSCALRARSRTQSALWLL